MRPRPDIPPVVPTQASSSESAIDLKHSDADQATLLLREEQKRQHDKRRGEAPEQAGEQDPEGEDCPVIDGTQRQGLWVDIKV